MVITAWSIGAFVLVLRALITKVIPEDAFSFMKEVNLEDDRNDGYVTRLYAYIFRVKEE